MSLFCLVHGSTQNASGWDLLVPEIEKFEHQTVRMNLPIEQQDLSGMEYAKIITQSIDRADDDVIAVAHSASGAFLPLVAHLKPVRHLIYLAAVIPKPGSSIFGQFRSTDPDMFKPKWIETGQAGKDPSQDDELAMQFLFHDCSGEVAEWALSTRILMYAKAAMNETFPFNEFPQVRSSYIVCSEDRTINPSWSRRAFRERFGMEVVELPGGHCPYVSRPAHLASVLNELVTAS